MKNNSKFHLFSMANIIIIVLSFLLFAPKYTLIHFINITFYIFSIFLIVFLFLHFKKDCLFYVLFFVFPPKFSLIPFIYIIFFFFFLFLIFFLFLNIKKSCLFDGLSF